MTDRTPTFCRDCDNVVEATRKQPPTRWLCRMHPVRFANGFIDPDWWVENEPFLQCRNVNAGSCPVFTRRRDGQKENGL